MYSSMSNSIFVLLSIACVFILFMNGVIMLAYINSFHSLDCTLKPTKFSFTFVVKASSIFGRISFLNFPRTDQHG